MAKKVVYSKGEGGANDFVYVDLLPEIRRARQFNVNVIITLSYALVAAFVLIYMPYRAATVVFEEKNGLNNDLRHELLLTQEEFVGYEIDVDVIEFEDNIGLLSGIRVDFNNLLDDVELITDVYDGEISYIGYTAETETLVVTIQVTNNVAFNILNDNFRNLPWVLDSTKDEVTPITVDGTTIYQTSFMLEVNPDVE